MSESYVRSADFRTNSYNPETRTFTAVVATGTPVLRSDAAGPFAEILPPDAFDLTEQNLPVLDSHNAASVRAILGRSLAIRREGEAIVADLRLSDADDVTAVGQRIADGTLAGVSIGYGVSGWKTSRERGQRTKTAERVTIREISITSMPADPNAGVRSFPGDSTMTIENREALIQRCRSAHPALSDEWARRMTDAGDVLSDDEVVADARESALAARQKRSAPVIRTHAASNDDPAVILDRQTEALAARMSGAAPSDGARSFMHMGLADFARDALTRSGQSVAMMGAEEVLTRAQHGTTDFPELLTGAGNRVLASAYAAAASPLKALARQRTAADFRSLSVLKLGEFSGLQKVSEHGEIKAMSTAEAREGYSLETFAGTFSLSRKAIVNDDLAAFGRWGEMMGRAAAETEAEQLLGLLTANSGGGVKLSDGKNLFHADHGNLAASGAAIGETTLSAARLALRTQKGVNGTTPVGIVPKHVLVGPALETTAEKAIAAINATTVDDVNPFGGRLSLLVEPRLTGNAWYIFGDPASAPVLEYAYLSSAPGPQLSSRDGWEVLGREFRVVLDFGCGATDHRGAYRNAGA